MSWLCAWWRQGAGAGRWCAWWRQRALVLLVLGAVICQRVCAWRLGVGAGRWLCVVETGCRCWCWVLGAVSWRAGALYWCPLLTVK